MNKIDYNTLTLLDEKFGTPFYIMDAERYRCNINRFLYAFRNRYDKVIAGYSFKTNYVPTLCQTAKDELVWAEVVSEMEYQLARKLGFDKIIFNGPIKRPHVFARALADGAIVNLDCEYEVDLACQYKRTHPTAEVGVGMRININLRDDNGNSTIQCGLRFGRFGFSQDIIERNVERLKNAGIKIVAIHGHTSSSDRAVLNYNIIIQHMLEACQQYHLDDIKYFDIGGGFFGAAPEGMDLTGRPTYEDYANCILNEVEKSAWFKDRQPTIIIEPGSSVVSNVFTYFTKVYQIKNIGKTNFVMVDGTVFDIKPTMHSNNLPHKVYCANSTEETFIGNVVGSTCMEKDILLNSVTLPKVKSGDFIQFNGVGAYTICLTPTFINFLAPILSFENGDFIEVRRRQTIEDILPLYKFDKNTKNEKQ